MLKMDTNERQIKTESNAKEKVNNNEMFIMSD